MLGVDVNEGGHSFGVECGNTRKSVHPLVQRARKVHRLLGALHGSMVLLFEVS